MKRDRSKTPGKSGAPARPSSPAGKPPDRGIGAPVPPVRQRGESKGAAPVRRHGGDAVAIYGFHAVREALRAKRRTLLALYVTDAAAAKLQEDIRVCGLAPRLVSGEELTRLLGANAAHQGVMLEAGPLERLDLSDIELHSGVVLALDQITDPHNVGAILRTAAAFAVDALIMTHRHAPDLSGALAKAASGGLEHAPIIEVVNLSRTLAALRERGFLSVGLDSEGPADLSQTALSAPLVLVLGGEGSGLRRLTREGCDVVARLDMPGAIKSLNVSNACAVALALVRARLRG